MAVLKIGNTSRKWFAEVFSRISRIIESSSACIDFCTKMLSLLDKLEGGDVKYAL